MQIENLDHVTINVVDAPASLHFYGEVLGLARLPSVRMPDHDLYYFQLNQGTRLELIAYDTQSEHPRFGSEAQGVYRHIALRVSGIHAWEAHLRANGVQVTSAAVWVPELQSTNMLVRECNGVEIEMLER